MKLKQTFFLFILYCTSIVNSSAQNILVDDSYSGKQLVENILINSTCANLSNISATGDTFPVGQNSYAYFNDGGSNFPIKEGIVLSTWSAKNSVGPYVFYRGDGNDSTWSGDPDINSVFGTASINATVLEFDITPVTNYMSFDYIFASNEYKDAQNSPCQYSDGFAFFIKEKGSVANYQNLAIIPGTNLPVTTKNLHPDIPIIGGCPAANAKFYNGNNTSTSPINYAGQTVVMNAQTTVVPGTTYHIKLVVADDINQYYDSAVFIKAGTFIPKIDLGPDRLLSNNPICHGENILLDTKLPATYNFKWYKNNVEIPGETRPTYTAASTGNYSVEIYYSPSTCSATTSIKLEFTPEIVLTNTSLTQCDPDGDGFSQFDLTAVDAIIRNNNASLNQVLFYESLVDAKAATNPILNPKTYINKTPNPILFTRVTNTYNCVNYSQLDLLIINNYFPPQKPISTCDGDLIQDGLYQFDMATEVSPQVLTGIPHGLLANYYLSESDAVYQINKIPAVFKNTIPFSQTIYLRIINGPSCFGIIPVTLIVNTFDPPNFEEETISICDVSSAILTVSPSFSSYLWNNGAITNSITVNAPGDYSVLVTDVNGCTKTKKFKVPISGIATITGAIINDFARNNNSILIQYTGLGLYEFSIDEITYQDNPLFIGMAPGIYNATARDKNGCGISIPFTVYVFDYPRFFTPNNDGFNDVWEIKNLNVFPNALISIFDRYGKLLKQLNALNPVWNGIYIGKELPADDYWFELKLEDARIIKGHFSLKR